MHTELARVAPPIRRDGTLPQRSGADSSVTDRDGTFFVLQSHLGELDPRADTFEIVPVKVG